MKELAVVKLTKSIFSKVGEKVAAKKKKWAEDAAISVEENKRREAEFKEDFSKAKEKLNTDVIKEEIQKGVEATTKKVEALKPKGLTAEDIAKKAEEEYNKAVNHSAEKAPKKVETKPTPKKEEVKVVKAKKVEEKVTPKPVTKSVEKKAVVTKETKAAPTKVVEAKTTTKPVAKKVEKKVETKPAAKEKTLKPADKTPTKPTAKKEMVKPVATKKKEVTSSKPTTKREEKLALYSGDITKHYGTVDEDFLAIIVKNLGPSIYKKNAEFVACSDSKELDTVRNNFLVKKLQMKESDDVLNGAIKEVCEELKASKNKYRATFYYALAKKLKVESKLK